MSSASARDTQSAAPDPAAAALLPGGATSRREFPVGDTLSVYAELYDNAASREPRNVDVAVRLVSEDGDDVFEADDTIAVDAAGRRANIAADITLRDIAPGRYLLRVEAQAQESGAKPVVRETVIAVAP